ncbi:unnamed protein product, partial [Lymnaea stagnalis]
CIQFCETKTNGIPIEESDSITLTCPNLERPQSTNVTYENGEQETIAVFTDTNCTVYTEGSHCYTNGGNVSFVTIPVSNKTRSIISFSCDYSKDIPVQFYARPSDLFCYDPILDATKTKIKIKCETTKIYPHAVCVFLNALNQSIQGNVSYSLHESYGSPGYYRSDCSLEVTARKLVSDH